MVQTVDGREVLIGAFDSLDIEAVHGPDGFGRISLHLGGEGFVDLGPADGPAAQAALEWRSRHLARWLAGAPSGLDGPAT
jgi:hypothetical protein